MTKTPAWARLDNAAKIFPPSSSKRDTKVFRFSCELHELVEKELLQVALHRALKEFPFYRSVLKQGFFWNYFEHSDLPALVVQENMPPCLPLYDVDSHSLLFQVTYYKRRINLEIYHALTDGTGALQFLRTLVYEYLMLSHMDEFQDNRPQMDSDASSTQKQEDSFQKYYTEDAGRKKEKPVEAYQVRSALLPEGRLRVLEGICSTKEVLRVAHENETTMTIYLTAALLCALAQDMPLHERKKPVVLSVPVNLRNYYDSGSARNFFSLISVGYLFDGEEVDFPDVIRSVKESFEKKLIKEKLGAYLSKMISFEKHPLIRVVPLPIKRFVMKLAHDRGHKETTGSISNIGRVSMPQELHRYIDRFEVFISTLRVQACICSFDDKLTISFTSPFASTELQKRFFRMLTAAGISVEVVTNLVNEEESEESR